MAQWRKVIVSGSSAVLNQISASGNIVPISDAGSDLGSSTLEWKDLYIDGVAYVDTLNASALGANLDHANYNSTNVDINSGDIASGVTINKSPVITLGGDLSGNVTLTNLASGTLTATIVADSVQGTMLNDDVADDSTIEISSNNLSVLKVPNALTAGVGISAGGTFDGAAARTFAIDFNEFSTVTPTDGDFLATLDSDGSTEQNTAI